MGGALSPHKGGVGGFTDEWVDGKCQWGKCMLKYQPHYKGQTYLLDEFQGSCSHYSLSTEGNRHQRIYFPTMVRSHTKLRNTSKNGPMTVVVQLLVEQLI